MASPAPLALAGPTRCPDDQAPAAIEKAFLLYDALRAACPAMRLSDLSRSTGLPKSTTHRLLGALIAAGVVVRFGVGYAAAERPKGSISGPKDQSLLPLAPFLGDVLARTRLTSSFAVLDGAEVVFAHRVFGHDNPPTPSDDTGRAAAHRTAAGRMLLSHDPRAFCVLTEEWGLGPDEAATMQRDLIQLRRRQFAVSVADGISCLAVPLPPRPGRPPIVLAVKAKQGSVDQDRTLLWLRRIADAAGRASIRKSLPDPLAPTS
jgi:DNA-binding IclR family transcriptional regulator